MILIIFLCLFVDGYFLFRLDNIFDKCEHFIILNTSTSVLLFVLIVYGNTVLLQLLLQSY